MSFLKKWHPTLSGVFVSFLSLLTLLKVQEMPWFSFLKIHHWIGSSTFTAVEMHTLLFLCNIQLINDKNTQKKKLSNLPPLCVACQISVYSWRCPQSATETWGQALESGWKTLRGHKNPKRLIMFLYHSPPCPLYVLVILWVLWFPRISVAVKGSCHTCVRLTLGAPAPERPHLLLGVFKKK